MQMKLWFSTFPFALRSFRLRHRPRKTLMNSCQRSLLLTHLELAMFHSNAFRMNPLKGRIPKHNSFHHSITIIYSCARIHLLHISLMFFPSFAPTQTPRMHRVQRIIANIFICSILSKIYVCINYSPQNGQCSLEQWILASFSHCSNWTRRATYTHTRVHTHTHM